MKKKICSWWCSAPRPNPSLLALAKLVLSEPYGLWSILKPPLTKHKSFAGEDLDEKSSSTGGHDFYLPGKHCIWKVRGGKQKVRACFPTWKVWVSPKFGVKQYTFHQLKTFRLKCLSWEENIYAYVYVDILVTYVDIQSSIDTYVHRWHLLFHLRETSLPLVQLTQQNLPADTQSCYKQPAPANISSGACSFPLMQLEQINMGD